jgi:predicted phage terminase large subunit-like protein
VTRTGIFPFPKHLDYINQALIKVRERAIKRLIITVPPRHGKSETTSKAFPVNVLLNSPRARVLLATYAAEFSAQWGRKARDLMAEVGEWYGLKVREDVAARDAWELSKWDRGLQRYVPTGGGMVTAGIGGPLTGRGGDIVIVDDPVKNSEEAFSAVYREKTWEWFNSTLYTRLEPDAPIIVIQTRWHEDDLAGRLILQSEAGGERWDIINLPAIAEDNDPLGREPGEALWPERYPIEVLKQIEESLGIYWFSALYQQKPIPVGKGLFQREWLRRYEETKDVYILREPSGSMVIHPKILCTRFSTMDLAVSTKTSADWTVLSTWAQTPNKDLILLDTRKVRMEGPDQLPLIQSVYMDLRPAQIYIEKAGYQLSLIQTAVRAGLPILPITPDGDKIARALSASARMKAGTIYFPIYADYLGGEDGIENELFKFPAAKHDDFVDTLSYAVFVNAGVGYVGNLG